MKKTYKKSKLENLTIKSFVTAMNMREIKGGIEGGASRGCSYDNMAC